MYPFLRMTLVLRSEARKQPLGIFDTYSRSMRCLPFDAGMFREMNNGRILTFDDLGRIGLAQRTAVTERGRPVATDRVADAMGLSQVSPPLPDWVTRWTKADTARPWPPEV